jgi:hypothetical protein
MQANSTMLGRPRVFRSRGTSSPGDETYGVRGGQDDRACASNDVYARDDAVYWGFSRSSLDRLAGLGGVRGFELVDAPEIAGHPRIIGTLDMGLIMRPGVAARPALPPVRAGGRW